MRRIFRPRNLLIAALLGAAGAAIVMWRKQQAEETWTGVEAAERADMASVAHLDSATSSSISATEAKSPAAAKNETAASVTEMPDLGDVASSKASARDDSQEKSSTPDESDSDD